MDASGNLLLLFFKSLPSFVGAETHLPGDWGETFIGIIMSEQEAMFCPCGKHSVGVFDSFGGEIVDHDADEGVGAREVDWGFVLCKSSGIDSGEDALSRCFFVAAGSVELTGEEETFKLLAHEVGSELERVCHIVFHGIAGTEHNDIFHSRNGFEESFLHPGGERGGNALDIHFFVGPRFLFEEHWVGIFVGKAYNFIFDTWTVSRTDTVDLPAVHGGFGEICLDDFVGIDVGMGLPAWKEIVLGVQFIVQEAHGPAVRFRFHF